MRFPLAYLLSSGDALLTHTLQSGHIHRYGRARVFLQYGDQEDIIEEAIMTCPVDCACRSFRICAEPARSPQSPPQFCAGIHYVPWEELIQLEKGREGQVLVSVDASDTLVYTLTPPYHPIETRRSSISKHGWWGTKVCSVTTDESKEAHEYHQILRCDATTAPVEDAPIVQCACASVMQHVTCATHHTPTNGLALYFFGLPTFASRRYGVGGNPEYVKKKMKKEKARKERARKQELEETTKGADL